MQNKIKAIIWDVDGTMVNSEALHLRCWDEVLIAYEHTLGDISEELRESIPGKKPQQIAEEFVAELQLPVDPEELWTAKTELFLELAETELELMPDLEEVLEKFAKVGYRQAIGSSMTAEYVASILDKYNLGQYFECVVTGEQVTNGKPDPEMYALVVEKLGVLPEECVVIEDATNGVMAAKAAGCWCVALANPDVIQQDLSMADEVVTSLKEININTSFY